VQSREELVQDYRRPGLDPGPMPQCFILLAVWKSRHGFRIKSGMTIIRVLGLDFSSHLRLKHRAEAGEQHPRLIAERLWPIAEELGG
jgi:hypothetical protein